MGVMGLPLAQGANTALLDALRRVEIGLSNLEVDDILSAPLHLLGGFQDIHDDERRDLDGSFVNSFGASIRALLHAFPFLHSP